jgi:hypothetical protein
MICGAGQLNAITSAAPKSKSTDGMPHLAQAYALVVSAEPANALRSDFSGVTEANLESKDPCRGSPRKRILK